MLDVADPDPDTMPEPPIRTTPDQALWLGAIECYLMDVRNPRNDNGEALNDFTGPQAILRYLCEMGGMDHRALARVAVDDLQGARFKRAG